MRRHSWLLVLVSIAAACSSGPPIYVPPPATPAPKTAPAPTAVVTYAFSTATATIRDLAGARVGSATFTDSHAGLIVSGTVSGIGLGAHAIHIHAVGKCESPFTTAGPHFNPDSKRHGFKAREGPHAGDLPNIAMPAAGTLTFDLLLKGVTVRGPNPLLSGAGTSIVIHSTRDDYITDPDGGSGGRLACGVIRGH
ncbi:MAG TPA: superoxide dismutase family protein [Gemmatimonadaceae bacterium]